MLLIICSQSSKIISFVIDIDTMTSWGTCTGIAASLITSSLITSPDGGTCMCLLLSAVLFWIGENECMLQFLRAEPRGTTMQSPMFTAPNLAVSCWRWSRCGAPGAEQEFNELLLFVSVVKDLKILAPPWSSLVPHLNSTKILKGKSALFFFSGHSSKPNRTTAYQGGWTPSPFGRSECKTLIQQWKLPL